MKAVGIVGASGSGKTTLITSLLAGLSRHGVRAGTVKHTHHRITLNDPRVTTFAALGAREVLVAGPARLMQFGVSDEALDLDSVLPRFADCDVILVEGFKGYAMPKIEVWRSGLGRPTLHRDWPGIVAVAADIPPPGLVVPYLDLCDTDGVAHFIMDSLSVLPDLLEEIWIDQSRH